jgi:hypothetical protein
MSSLARGPARGSMSRACADARANLAAHFLIGADGAGAAGVGNTLVGGGGGGAGLVDAEFTGAAAGFAGAAGFAAAAAGFADGVAGMLARSAPLPARCSLAQ